MRELLERRIAQLPRVVRYGRVVRITGLVVEVVGIDIGVGEICRIASLTGGRTVLAEACGFQDGSALLMSLGELDGVHPGAMVVPMGRAFDVRVGPGMLGRVFNGLGELIDGGPPVRFEDRMPLSSSPPNPLQRRVIDAPLETGVRAIDGLLTIGRGQRVGIFAGSGVGKSSLLGMIARRAEADVNVIALLGERGREVRDFIDGSLGPEGLARSVLVVATGDEAALVRARGALVATAIAEYFRDAGKQVLLMVDSITRVAMAWREIGLAVGEPPTTKGYPPSVFASLPRLLERAGNAGHGGITGLYTVLVDGDDFNEPVADATRSILDGHFVLSRKLAAVGHYPAIDVLESKSRVRDHVITASHRVAAQRFLRSEAAYREKEDLVLVGAYQRGADPIMDSALQCREPMLGFLRQSVTEHTPIETTVRQVHGLAQQLDAALPLVRTAG
ncbi:MAG: FliI/YscN family ATPase [Gemmatimonadetes bacterium]|nr:FliI/YscN family ATPase [Gemmatimonadota bacterium]